MIYDQLKKENGDIIIFGAGVMGRYILSLCYQNQIEVSAFCDNERKKSYIGNLAVLTVSEVVDKYGTEAIFIITPLEIEEIVTQLKDNNCLHYYSMCEFFDPRFFLSLFSINERQKKESIKNISWVERNWYHHYFYLHPEALRLESLDFVITERCSLRCRDCSNLMQYYTSPYDFKLDDLKKQLSRAMELYAQVSNLCIIGGEPFMHKKINDIIQYAHSFSEIKRITIFTNATICPAEETLSSWSDYGNVTFSVSDYGDISMAFNKLICLLKKYKFKYAITRDRWTSCSSFQKHNRSLVDQKRVFANCCVNKTVTLLQGKIYPCPFIAHGINLQALPNVSESHVDIMKSNNLADIRDALRTLHQRTYHSLCDFCNGRPNFPIEEEIIEPHIQTKEPLIYKKYEGCLNDE